jgi:hypothetical protein
VNTTSLSRVRRGLTAAAAAGALVLGVLAYQAPAQAALAPINDLFDGATMLSGASVTVTGSNVDASTEPGEPTDMGFGAALGASVWYRWTAPVTADYAISTAGSDFDTELVVYTGSSVGALTWVASNDDGFDGGSTSATGFAATAGATYDIQVGGYDDPTDVTPAKTGTVRLALGPAAVAGNMTYNTAANPNWVPLPGCLVFRSSIADLQSVDSGCGNGAAGETSAYTVGLLPAGSYYVVAFSDGSGPIFYPGVTDSAQATRLTIPAGGCTLTGLDVDFNADTMSGPTGRACQLSPTCTRAQAAIAPATAALAAGKAALAKDKLADKKLRKKLTKAKRHHRPTKELRRSLKKANKRASAATKMVGTAAAGLTAAQQKVTASC